MELEPVLKEELQKKLSGMSAGFTLSPDTLTVRFGTYEIGYVLVTVNDHSTLRCHCCDNPVKNDIYYGTVTLKVGGNRRYEQQVSLCYDCAFPQ